MTYVCDAADVAEYGVFTMESFNNKRMLFEKGIRIYCSHWVERIEPGKVRLSYAYKFGPDLLGPTSGDIPRKDNGGEFDLEIDAVILVDLAPVRHDAVARTEGAPGRMGRQRRRGRVSHRRLQGACAAEPGHLGCAPAGAGIR